MSGKIKLGKSRDSRTRGKAKDPVGSKEVLQLKEQLKNADAGFIDYLLKKGYSGSTVQGYLQDVNRFEAWTEKENASLESAGYADLLAYIQGKRTRVQQRTLSTIINSLKHYYNFLMESGTVSENPALQISIRGIKRKKLYDIISKPELENLYYSYQPKEDKANENQNWYKTSQLTAVRNKAITGLLVYQGLTATELARLTEKDVKLREGKIYIAGTRRSNERELVLESVQMLDLMEYVLKIRKELLEITGKESGQLFISTGSSQRFANLMHKLIEKLHQLSPKVTSAQQIRASVITHWLKNHNLRRVQYMAGHRFVSSTEAFLVNDLDDLQEDIGKFHPIG